MKFKITYEYEYKPNTSYKVSAIIGYVNLGSRKIFKCSVPTHLLHDDSGIHSEIKYKFAAKMAEVLGLYQ